jgi:hypothetical protein
MPNPIPQNPLATTPNPLLLMFKMLRLLPLPPTRLLRLNLFNLPPLERINPKKGRVRTRRIKIIHNLRRPKHNFLTLRISANPDTFVLSVVMITTLRIVQDELRLLSSFKGP